MMYRDRALRAVLLVIDMTSDPNSNIGLELRLLFSAWTEVTPGIIQLRFVNLLAAHRIGCSQV